MNKFYKIQNIRNVL